jgi:polyisoprenoid-binding protein YceI
MTKIFWTLVILCSFMCFSSQSYAGTTHFDEKTSSIIFQVKQLAGQVVGGFKEFKGSLEVNGTQVEKVTVDITMSSVFTRQLQRDWDLLGPDLFDVAQFPTAHFVSQQVNGDTIQGDLTFHGKTKPVMLKVTVLSEDAGASTFVMEGTISRKEFGVTYNRKLDNGQFLLADEVELRAILRPTP